MTQLTLGHREEGVDGTGLVSNSAKICGVGGGCNCPPEPPGSAGSLSDTAHNSANEMEVVKDMFPSLGLTNFLRFFWAFR